MTAETLPDDVYALQNEIIRLRYQIAGLKAQHEELEAVLRQVRQILASV